jgi:hypothetical protein
VDTAPTRKFNFRAFDRSTAQFLKTPTFTIQVRGTLSLNGSAFQALGSPTHVELLYDEDERVIGLRPCESETIRSYPIRPQGTNSQHTYLVAGKAFLQFFGIPFDTPLRYRPEVVDGILVVDLKSEAVTATSNRNRAAERAEQEAERAGQTEMNLASQNGSGNGSTGQAAQEPQTS